MNLLLLLKSYCSHDWDNRQHMCNIVKIYGYIFLVYLKSILPKWEKKDFQLEKQN